LAQSVTGLFHRYSELVRSRNLREITRLYRFPCMIEADDRTIVTKDAGALEAFLAERLARLDAAQVKDLVPRVAAVEMPRADRFRAWVRWSLHYSDRVEHDAVGMIYYLVRSPRGVLTIEMVSVVSMAPIEAAARESAEVV
jgi:hypothetical protein